MASVYGWVASLFARRHDSVQGWDCWLGIGDVVEECTDCCVSAASDEKREYILVGTIAEVVHHDIKRNSPVDGIKCL